MTVQAACLQAASVARSWFFYSYLILTRTKFQFIKATYQESKWARQVIYQKKEKLGSFGALRFQVRIQKKQNGDITASYRWLTSLEGCPEIVLGAFGISGNGSLNSLRGINQLKEMNGKLFVPGCLLTSHILVFSS
jgi:hypothetical protein